MHPANASSGIFSLAFQDVRNGIAVGGDYAHPESSDLPNVLRTDDGGKTWRAGAQTNPGGLYFSSVTHLQIQRKDILVAAGIKGAFIFADEWSRASDENLNSIAVAMGPNPGVWVVGPKGTVAHLDIALDFYPKH